ncbi:hypothetical protein JTB14_017069 [Gonioctena quinquepunctata]|nr:hypothetical protein JTB14_017069 [Gonioctena quinquepunctata]
MVSKCCVCREKRGKNHTRTLHRLPKDSESRKKWVAFLGLHSTQDNINEVGVCSSHFPKDDFIIKPSGNHYLKSTALPILRDGQSLNDFPDMQKKQLGRRTEEFMEPPLKKLVIFFVIHFINKWLFFISDIEIFTILNILRERAVISENFMIILGHIKRFGSSV